MPTSGGPPSWGLGEVLTISQREKWPCYATDTSASGLDSTFCTTQAMEKGHENLYME